MIARVTACGIARRTARRTACVRSHRGSAQQRLTASNWRLSMILWGWCRRCVRVTPRAYAPADVLVSGHFDTPCRMPDRSGLSLAEELEPARMARCAYGILPR